MFTLIDGYMALLVAGAVSVVGMVMLRAYVYVDMIMSAAWIKDVIQDTEVNTITIHKEETMVDESTLVRGMTMYGASAGID